MPKQKKSIKMRRRNKTNEPPKKRHRSDSPHGPVEMTNITDINDDCLEHILKKLPFEDLFNVADSCKRLRNAARLAFTSKYGRHVVHLLARQRVWARNQLLVFIDDDDKHIRVSHLPTALRFMRCFGESITKLDIGLRSNPKYIHDKINYYFMQYCADSVVHLEYGKDTLKNLTKPFTKVETVHFIQGDFRCKPSDINRCFPNLRAITMNPFNAVDCVMAHFPKLERLKISVSVDQYDKLATTLRLNPKLRSLCISGYKLNFELLRFLSECPQLESLYMSLAADFTVGSKNDPIHFKSLKELRTSSSDLQALDSANIEIMFDQLEELSISGQVNQSVFRLISKYPNISKFTCSCNGKMNEEAVVKFAKVLTSVTEISFGVNELSAETVMAFITNCSLIKIFRFRVSGYTEYSKLEDMIGPEWRSSIDKYQGMILQR